MIHVFVDFEMCRVLSGKTREKYPCRNELIEIGAVILDDSFDIADSFKTYVAPEFGEVDPYIQRLTGISAADTKNAPGISEALELFASWLPEDAVLVSWSENDEKQIRSEMTAKNISMPKLEVCFDGWIDCQKTFSEKMNSPKTYRLSEALIISDIDYEEGAHDALVDAHNTALLFAKMQREPKLKLISCYMQEDTETSVCSAFSGLLANYRLCGVN